MTGPISLYEAMARALKFNLDLRLEITEKLLAQKELDLSRYEQLPDFVANASYNSRSNFSGANSQSLLTGVESLVASTSSERDVFTRDLTLTWNILDFGVSYYRAQQAADRVLIAEEQRRKVVNQLIEDVRRVYWRAVSNDRLITRLEDLLVRVNEAIEQSKQVEEDRLDKPLTALTYQRELIGIKRELQELQRELSIAKIQLAALMNLPLGQEFDLVLPERSDELRGIDLSPQLIEELSLLNRSEMREVAYEKRINAKETRAAILQLLPGLNLNFGQNYSTNEFLFNNDWLSYGAQIGWNLINIFKYPATRQAVETQGLVLDARRLALAMAIMTQVHVGLARHEHASREYATAAEYHTTQKKILDQILAAADTQSVSEQSVIREEMNTLVADVKYDIAYADLENSYAAIYASMGVDPLPAEIGHEDLNSLADALKTHFESLDSNINSVSMTLEDVN
ncbi:MAG: TolC family protein [Thiotrichales bacterium]|nr:TolC family protein [Thiotrichales bacterium]